jgi:hypothetical protein
MSGRGQRSTCYRQTKLGFTREGRSTPCMETDLVSRPILLAAPKRCTENHASPRQKCEQACAIAPGIPWCVTTPARPPGRVIGNASARWGTAITISAQKHASGASLQTRPAQGLTSRKRASPPQPPYTCALGARHEYRPAQRLHSL